MIISTSRIITDRYGQSWTILFACQLPQDDEPEYPVVLE